MFNQYIAIMLPNHNCRAHCATMERCTQKQLVELSNVERMAMFIDITQLY